MPSKEEYLDNLLKGIENTEKEEKVQNTSQEDSQAETEKESENEMLQNPQIDMSDMDDLLQSALEAQKRDIPETQQPKNKKDNDIIHPEETSSMSEDEIDRLLQQNQEQADNAEQQRNQALSENDDLIKMLENADDESLTNVLDQVATDTEIAEEPEKEKHGRWKSFLDRFKKKKAKKSKNSAADETEYEALSVDMAEPDKGEPDKGKTDSGEEDRAEQETTSDTPEAKDDDLEALLAGAFPQTEDAEHTEEDNSETDVINILKAAGADIVDDASQKKEKKGFFSRLLDLFTEEDEEDEEESQLKLSEENKQILDEMGKDQKKKGKKEKKPKKEKAAKEKKPKKENKKKEKKEKKEGTPAAPEKKLSPKKVIPIVVVCISLGAVILLLSSFLSEYMTRRSGRNAYYAGDYQTCYQNFFGKELDETEQVMYSKSESILTIRMWLREYEVFVNEGSELEALDSLLQAVHDYPLLLNYATEYNAQDEVTVAFQEILNVLSQKYGLSQEEAQEIADISNDVEYTQKVMDVLQKLGLESWNMPETAEDREASNEGETVSELPDPLPEEMEIEQ